MEYIRCLWLLAGLIFIVGFGIVFVHGSILTIEARIVSNESYIMIEAPNYIGLGEVIRGQSTDPQKICINNTGTENITVSFSVPSDKFSNYLFAKKYSTSNYFLLSDYTQEIKSNNLNPSNTCLWLTLNLTNYNSPIYATKDYIVNVTISAVPDEI